MADNAVYRALKLYVCNSSNHPYFRKQFNFQNCMGLIFVQFCLFNGFSRHIAPDKFYIEPRDQHSVGDKILEIDRVTQELILAGW